MRYNPDTESAFRSLEALAEQTRKIITKLNPPAPKDIVWSVTEGRWVANTPAIN